MYRWITLIARSSFFGFFSLSLPSSPSPRPLLTDSREEKRSGGGSGIRNCVNADSVEIPSVFYFTLEFRPP